MAAVFWKISFQWSRSWFIQFVFFFVRGCGGFTVIWCLRLFWSSRFDFLSALMAMNLHVTLNVGKPASRSTISFGVVFKLHSHWSACEPFGCPKIFKVRAWHPSLPSCSHVFHQWTGCGCIDVSEKSFGVPPVYACQVNEDSWALLHILHHIVSVRCERHLFVIMETEEPMMMTGILLASFVSVLKKKLLHFPSEIKNFQVRHHTAILFTVRWAANYDWRNVLC